MPERTETDFQGYLQRLGDRADPERGFFGPDSVVWRVSREPVLLIAGMRALLMQVAHPKVAQGVADHSRYREDPLGRGVRTFTAVHAMVFGTRRQALEAAARVHGVHDRVRGRVRGELPPGMDRDYRADDPALALWVAATLVDSSVVAYELFVGALTDAEKEQLYRESKTFGALFGVPENCYPATWAAFRQWMDERCASPGLTVTATARDICASLLKSTWLTRLLAPFNYVTAAMLLPDALADAYGLRRTLPVRAGFRLLVAVVRLLVASVPRRWRAVPAARRRERVLGR